MNKFEAGTEGADRDPSSKEEKEAEYKKVAEALMEFQRQSPALKSYYALKRALVWRGDTGDVLHYKREERGPKDEKDIEILFQDHPDFILEQKLQAKLKDLRWDATH